MKAKLNAYILFLALIALPLLSLAGCSEDQSAAPNSSPTYSGSSTNNLSSTAKSESSMVKPEVNSSVDNTSNIQIGRAHV